MSIRFLTYVLAAALGVCGASASAQTSLCENPAEQCATLVAPECLQKLGAGAIDANTPALCAAQLDVYRNCLTMVSQNCVGAPQVEELTLEASAPAVASSFAPGSYNKVTYSLQGCVAANADVYCDVLAEAEERVGSLGYYASAARAVLPSADLVEASKVEGGGRSGTQFSFQPIEGVPVRIRYTFSNIKAEHKNFSTFSGLELFGRIVWRNVPIK